VTSILPQGESECPNQPPRDCPLCPRLHAFRHANRAAFPDFHNDPVPSFGPLDAKLLIVGLAPGLKGANRTGRPFTGDYAGDLLYATLKKRGLAKGNYDPRALACPRAGLRPDPGDGFELIGCRVTNAVRCVPPENKPLPAEINTCRPFLIAEIAAMPKLAAILALGGIAHNSVLTALNLKKKDHGFGHGVHYTTHRIAVLASYHCSRYNTNTGVLTEAMFDAVVQEAKTAAGL
jgi:uracil-DNA glycosylase